MARVQLLLCFTVLIASVALLDVVSAIFKFKPSLPQIEAPETVKDVEPYTVKVVMVFVSDLEKECPKDSKFKAFFERLRACAKYVCPIKRSDEKDFDRDMKAKTGSLLQTISSFAVGKIKAKIQEEKTEALETFKKLKSIGAKIMGGRKKDESEDMKLTAEQQKEIKEGILSWQTVITKITTTMVESSTTSSSSTSTKESSSGSSKTSGGKTSSYGTGTSFSDTTGSGSYMGSPSGSPASGPSASTFTSAGGSYTTRPSTYTYGASGGSPASGPSASTYAGAGGRSTSYSDTTGGSYNSPAGSPSGSPMSTYGSSISSTSSSTRSASSSTTTSSASSASATTTASVAEVEAETSKDIMTFIMNLEKKCPPKEEYKSFFEKLKATMAASVKVTAEKKKGFLSGLKSAAGKVSDSMSFITSRIGGKSSEMKKSMEAYHKEVMTALQELDAIHGKIISENKGKKDGSLTVTATQQTEIKQTITKWEQVTTQFVETAIKSEATTNTTAGIDKMKLN